MKSTVPLDSKSKEMFYFCQVHAGMSGMIRVINPVENANSLVKPFDPGTYDIQSDKFDSVCGTPEVSMFHTYKDSASASSVKPEITRNVPPAWKP